MSSQGADSAKGAQRISFLASSPDGFSIRHLGRPYNADFDLLPGEEGKSLFSKPTTFVSEQHRLSTHFVEVSNEESFAANASAWGLVDAGLSFGSHRRYVSRRLLLVHDVVELDETDGVAEAAPSAVYYPWRVHRGWSYEVVCDGRSNQFKADFKASFLTASGGIEGFSKKHGLNCRALGRGLTIDGAKSVFADDIEELKDKFKTSVEPVPVAVEWRRIPGRSGHSSKGSETRKGCAGGRGCEPCEEWAFERFHWTIPKQNSESGDWDGDGSPPDIQVTIKAQDGVVLSSKSREGYRINWEFGQSFRVTSDEEISIVGKDQDLLGHDPIASLHEVVPRFLPDGVWQLANGQARLEGSCVVPKWGSFPS